MKKYLERAQSLLDTNQSVPEELFQSLNSREQQLLQNMIELKRNLTKDFDRVIPDTKLRINQKLSLGQKSSRNKRIDFRFLIAAAALFAAVMIFPVSQFVESEKLMREETSSFVDQLFLGDDQFCISSEIESAEGWYGFDELLTF